MPTPHRTLHPWSETIPDISEDEIEAQFQAAKRAIDYQRRTSASGDAEAVLGGRR